MPAPVLGCVAPASVWTSELPAGMLKVLPQREGIVKELPDHSSEEAYGYCVMSGHPCRLLEKTASTGPHGKQVLHLVGADIFTTKKYEMDAPADYVIAMPLVRIAELQCLLADDNDGSVSLLTENGETRDDLMLPTFQAAGLTGKPTAEDEEVAAGILKGIDNGGKDVVVFVERAWGVEKIVGYATR